MADQKQEATDDDVDAQFPMSTTYQAKIRRTDDSGWDDVELEVSELTVPQLAQVSRIIGDALRAAGGLDLIAFAAEHDTEVIKALSIALRKPVNVVERLAGSCFFELVLAIFEKNREAFTRRLGPRVFAMLATFTTSAEKAAPNGNGPTSSPTSGAMATSTLSATP